MTLVLECIKRTHPEILADMSVHYSHPGGFVGRNICYAVLWDGKYYGSTVGGSATRFLPNRNDFFKIGMADLNRVVNNIFFHMRTDLEYPVRNFVPKVVAAFELAVQCDWKLKYGDSIVGIETLVEPPRTGEIYRRCGYTLLGVTRGYTCKRVAGKSSDSWSGKRVWDTSGELRPKLVFGKAL